MKTDLSKTDEPIQPSFLGPMPLTGAAVLPSQVWTWQGPTNGAYPPSICDLTLNTAAANPATTYTVGTFPMSL